MVSYASNILQGGIGNYFLPLCLHLNLHLDLHLYLYLGSAFGLTFRVDAGPRHAGAGVSQGLGVVSAGAPWGRGGCGTWTPEYPTVDSQKLVCTDSRVPHSRLPKVGMYIYIYIHPAN